MFGVAGDEALRSRLARLPSTLGAGLRKSLRYSESVLSVAREKGIEETLRFMSFRIGENYGEWRWGIETMGTLRPFQLGYTDKDFHEYGPPSYEVLDFLFGKLPIKDGESIFVAYGCGMGRALVVAGSRPFRRVVGVEYSEDLGAKAKENIRRARRRLKCPVDVVVGDARSFPVPPQADIIYFNNPFFGSVLQSVIDRIRASLRENPRELTIAYGNSRAFDELIQGRTWIEKTIHRTFYKDFIFSMYRCRPD